MARSNNGSISGPQGSGKNGGNPGQPGRGNGGPRVAPMVGGMSANGARQPIAPVVGPPGPNPSPQVSKGSKGK